MATAPDVKLHDLVADFGVGVLVTRGPGGALHGRPMALAEAEPGGTLWFATDRHSAKVDELAADPHVAVTLQSKTQFVSLSGTAEVVEDRAKVRELWKPAWAAWFPKGKDDPDLVLLRVTGTEGEYWDGGGTAALKYLIKAGKALLTGERPQVGDDPQVHARVAL
jgi:general stress protein 26